MNNPEMQDEQPIEDIDSEEFLRKHGVPTNEEFREKIESMDNDAEKQEYFLEQVTKVLGAVISSQNVEVQDIDELKEELDQQEEEEEDLSADGFDLHSLTNVLHYSAKPLSTRAWHIMRMYHKYDSFLQNKKRMGRLVSYILGVGVMGALAWYTGGLGAFTVSMPIMAFIFGFIELAASIRGESIVTANPDMFFQMSILMSVEDEVVARTYYMDYRDHMVERGLNIPDYDDFLDTCKRAAQHFDHMNKDKK